MSKALLKVGALDVVLVRAASVDKLRVQELESYGAEVYGIAYDSESQLVGILKGTDVVISTLNCSSLDDQKSTSDAESNASDTKEGIVKIAESLELPHTRILDGLFPH
ncbi:hypothetical protein RhiTH_010622 [Rhizoctonia solani]